MKKFIFSILFVFVAFISTYAATFNGKFVCRENGKMVALVVLSSSGEFSLVDLEEHERQDGTYSIEGTRDGVSYRIGDNPLIYFYCNDGEQFTGRLAWPTSTPDENYLFIGDYTFLAE